MIPPKFIPSGATSATIQAGKMTRAAAMAEIKRRRKVAADASAAGRGVYSCHEWP